MAEREEGERRYDEKVLREAADEAIRQIEGPCGPAVANMAREGRAVQVVGRVVNGKVEIDQSALDTFARRFPEANMAFLAVNAPFDKEFSAALLEA